MALTLLYLHCFQLSDSYVINNIAELSNIYCITELNSNARWHLQLNPLT